MYNINGIVYDNFFINSLELARSHGLVLTITTTNNLGLKPCAVANTFILFLISFYQQYYYLLRLMVLKKKEKSLFFN